MRDTPRDDGPLEPPSPPPPPAGPAGTTGIHPRGLLVASRIARVLQRALWFGLAIAFVSGLAVGLAVPPGAGLIAAAVVAALAGSATGTAVAFLSVDDPVRRAFEAFSWLGRRELDRARMRTGRGAPTDLESIHRWLREVPSSPATAAIRAELLAMLGRAADARAEMAAVPATSADLERLERASVEALITFIETGRLEQQALREVVAGFDPASEEALEGSVVIAIGEARALANADDPAWTRPLEAVRPRLGRAAVVVTLRDTWSKLAIQYAVTGALAALLAGAVRLL